MKRRDERFGQFTQADLDAIVAELGLTEEERKQIPGAGWAAQNRGRASLERNDFDDAIEDATAAAALLPGEKAPLELLAETYRQRWQKSGLDWDRDEARRMAESALRIDPTSVSAKNVLAHLSTGPSKPRSSGSSALPWVIAALGVFLVLGCLASIGAVLIARVEGSSNQPLISTDPPVVKKAPKPNERDRTLPVKVVDDVNLEFDIRRSELNNYDDTSWYKIAGVVTNKRDKEFEQAEFLIELLDKNGKKIASDEGSAPDYGFSGNAVRIGDTVEFNKLMRTDNRARSVRISAFVFKKEVPSSGQYPPSPPVELKGKTPSRLEVRVRKVTDREKTILVKQKGERFHTVILEIENVGGAPIRMLKLWAVYTDADGKEVLKDDFYVVSSSDPPMLPKDVRIAHHIETVPASVAGWHVRVAEAE